MVVQVLLIVQHGEKTRAPGDPGLTRVGSVQARVVASAIVATQPSAAVVVSSPLRRAVETAEPIAEACGVELLVDGRVRERMNHDESIFGSLDEFLAEWGRATDDRCFVPRAGDSSSGAADRFIAAIDDLATRFGPRAVVVVSHGGVTVDTLRTLLGDDELAAIAPTAISEGVPPAAITTLHRSEAGWTLESFADTSHLVGR